MIPTPPQDKDFPWWLLVAGGLAAYLMYRVVSDALYAQVLGTLSKGIGVTIFVTLVGFTLASAIGLVLAVGSLSRFLFFRQISRFYIEIVRGIPIIVLLLYVAFVLAPFMVSGWNWLITGLGFDPIRNRDFSLLWRAIIALTIGYSAFIAEVFRAGIQSVESGQIEAAKALGLTGWQRFRLIIFPLGNDFIAMIKDSSLVSVLGVLDITQLGKVTAAGNFRYFETYNVVALIYLIMTVSLSLMLRRLEARMRQNHVD